MKKLVNLLTPPPLCSFGPEWRKEIDITTTDKPIGSGCVAQVYRGRLVKANGLLKPGQEVSVTLLHLHIRSRP